MSEQEPQDDTEPDEWEDADDLLDLPLDDPAELQDDPGFDRPMAFMANLTAFTSGTGGKWVEDTLTSAGVATFTDGRQCTSFTQPVGGAAAVVGPKETGFLAVEQADLGDNRFSAYPSGCIDCYLTQVGGTAGSYTYDGYMDSAKTIKIFAVQQSTNSGGTTIATKGLARLVGNVWRFVSELTLGGGSGSLIPVFTKHNGDDGDGYPLYDIYATSDPGLVTPLATARPVEDRDGGNLGGPVRWINDAAGQPGSNVFAAASADWGWAFSDGANYHLLWAQETLCVQATTVGKAAI